MRSICRHKENVNYVYCAMHHIFTQEICNCRNQFQNLKSCKENSPAFCFLLLCSICAHQLKVSLKSLPKLLEKSKVEKFKHSKCLLVRVTCPKNSNTNIS